MSLKAFHLVFIIASILLAVGTAVWSLMDYFSPHGTKWDLAGGLGALIIALALAVYEKYFLKKLKNVSYL